MIYIAAAPTHGTEVFVGDEDELAEVRWVSLAEADELMPRHVRAGARVPGPRARRGSDDRAAAKRRSPGEGRLWPYQTTAASGGRSGTRPVPARRRETANGAGVMTQEGRARGAARQQSASPRGEYVEPSKQRLGAYLAEWSSPGCGWRRDQSPATARTCRLHIEPYRDRRGAAARSSPGSGSTAHYRLLEKSGREDHREGEGLSARTVRYIHTIIHGVLGAGGEGRACCAQPGRRGHAADREGGEGAGDAPVERRPARRVPGMGRGRTAQNYALWHVLAMTGMRRGEALALRWRDVDLERGHGRGPPVGRHGPGRGRGRRGASRATPRAASRAWSTSTTATVAVLRALASASAAPWRCSWPAPDALVFGDLEGAPPQPASTSPASSPATWPGAARRSARTPAGDPAS